MIGTNDAVTVELRTSPFEIGAYVQAGEGRGGGPSLDQFLFITMTPRD